MKYFLKITKVSSLIIAVILIAAFSLSYFYEDEIKENIINRINNEIKAEINVEKINFTVLKRFPLASLQLKNVFLVENKTEKDTIFSAQNIFVKFKLLDIIRKNYKVSNIEIQNPNIKFIVYEDGTHNFDILFDKENESESVLVKLEKLEINNGKILFNNKITKQSLDLNLKSINAKGIFATEKLELNFLSNFIINSYITKDKEVISNKYLQSNLDLYFDKNTNRVQLKNAEVNYNGLKFKAVGDFANNEDLSINISLNTENLDLKKTLKEFPEESLQNFENYDISAKANIIIDINGNLTKYKMPDVKASFSVFKAKLKHKISNQVVDNIVIKGDYNNGNKNTLASSTINIQEFSFNSDIGKANGKLIITDLLKPKAKVNIDAKLDLNKLDKFLDIKTIKKTSGKANILLKSDLNFYNVYDSNDVDIQLANINGKAEFIDVNLILENGNKFEEINSKLIFDKDKVQIYNLNCLVNDFNSNFKGNIYNLDKILTNPLFNNRLSIKGELNSEYLDIDKLFFNESENSSSNLNLKYEIKLDLNVKKARYLAIDIEDFNGYLFYNEDITKVNIESTKAFKGEIKAYVEYNTADKKNNLLSIDGNTMGVNIEDVFKHYNNFDQDIITYKNLKGKLWADFSIRILESKSGEWNSESLNLSSKLEIKNGELNDVKELNAIAKYTKIDNFNNIKFSTLKNDIFIAKNVIHIPQMDINSDKMNISLYGKHNFDNSYEYHFKIRLAEILAKNIRQNKVSEFGEIVDDEAGLNLFLKIVGHGEEFEVSYDGKAARNKVKEDIKSEGQQIKEALKNEFGSKKKTKEKTEKEKEKELLERQTKGETIIEWEDF